MNNNQNPNDLSQPNLPPEPNKKMKSCKSCGATMAKSAKICPQCGAKNKSHKVLLIILIILGIIVVIGALGGGDGKDTESLNSSADNTAAETEATVEYTQLDVVDLFKALNDNAAKAQKEYEDCYVEVTGYVTNIDASGDYIDIGAKEDDYEYMFDTFQCYIQNDDQLNQVMELSKGDRITVKGQITDVGEVLGYSLDIESISK